jgi:hypothetical protein
MDDDEQNIDYAIEVLQDEWSAIERCLNDWVPEIFGGQEEFQKAITRQAEIELELEPLLKERNIVHLVRLRLLGWLMPK